MPHIHISAELLGLIFKVHKTSEQNLYDFINQILEYGLTIELMVQGGRCDPEDLNNLIDLVITSKNKLFGDN